MTSSWRELADGRIAASDDRPRWPAAAPTEATIAAELEAATARVGGHVVRTPVKDLEVAGNRCLAKLESLQRTGSFKIRGAANRMLTLSDRERAAGVVTASSGNHGIAVASLAGELGLRAVVCVPHDADPLKLAAIRAAGADVRAEAEDYEASERQAHALAERFGLCFIHAFDDLRVIAGHATLGLELVAQVPNAAAVLIPLSGGGLAAGVASALRLAGSSARLIGVSLAHAPVMYRSLLAGTPVSVQEQSTLAGALSGGLGDRNRYSLELVSGLLDEVWLVSEEEIAAAIIWGAESLGGPVEGAGAAALAALALPAATSVSRSGPMVAVVSGGNVDTGTVEHARQIVARTRPPELRPQAHPVHH